MEWEALATKLAGVAGAIISMRYLPGTWMHRGMTAAGGVVFSFFATDYVTARLSLPEGLSAFLLGMFGMSLLSRIWEWLQTASVSDFLISLFKGPPKSGEDKK